MADSDTILKKDENSKEEDWQGKYLRALADYQNLEKQTRAWRDEFTLFANSNLIRELLEVLDDLEEAQRHLNDEGIQLVIDKLKGILKNSGLEEIEAEGAKFAPETMEAVEIAPGEEEHKVAKVLQKGYKLNGKVIRAAKVGVGKA